MIPTNKFKKLVLQCIVKFINSVQIWEDCSMDIFETTENQINPLQVKEIFCKEILPDLSYNNFGYDNEIIEKLKSLKLTVDNTSDGTSSIDWMEVDKDIYNPIEYAAVKERMADLHTESLIESAEEEDNESEGDVSINAILAKYNIPDRVHLTQASVCYQESEQLYCFRESQLINVFGDGASDPLANNSNTDISKDTSDYDDYDHLCDGGRVSEIFKHVKPSTSLESTADNLVPFKRKSSSLSDIDLATDFDENISELSVPKRSRMSNSLDTCHHSSFSEADTRQIGLDTIIQQLEDLSSENCVNDTANESCNIEDKSNNESNQVSNITENNEAVQKPTEEIVAEIQKRINEAGYYEEVQKILDANKEYITMIAIPFTESDIQVENKPEKNENDKKESTKTVELESQNVKNIEQPKEKPLGIKFARKLKSVCQKLSYDSPECSDSISLEESLNPLLLNDTVLSGSHKDCIGIVRDLEPVSSSTQSSISLSSHPSNSISLQDHSFSVQQISKENAADTQATEEDIIERLQALIDAARCPEEINRILSENEQYLCDLILPYFEPEILKTPTKSSQKESEEEIIERIQNQLDTAEDSDEINKILSENEDYIEYLIIPFAIPELQQDTQLNSAKPSHKVNHETQNDVPNLERNSSRRELSFLLSQNVNVRRKNAAVPQPKKDDENVIIDLTDDH